MKWMTWTLWALLVSGAFVGDARAQSVDDFLETGWIWWTTNTTARTYDFAQHEVDGVESVEVRNWTDYGTLGWQQTTFPAVYETDGQQIAIYHPSGYTELYEILEADAYTMRLVSSSGYELYWYNCAAVNAWPVLIFQSTSSCRGY
jgi:hypothetical protein